MSVRREEFHREAITGQYQRDSAEVISAMVPLVNLFGYATDLARLSSGQASFTMQFRCYRPVPRPPGDPPFRPAMGMGA
jgi:elongation factor G